MEKSTPVTCSNCLAKFDTSEAFKEHYEAKHVEEEEGPVTPPKVELIVTEAYAIDREKGLIVLVDPMHVGMLDQLDTALCALMGHERVVVFPLRPEAIKFYQVADNTINVMAPEPNAPGSTISTLLGDDTPKSDVVFFDLPIKWGYDHTRKMWRAIIIDVAHHAHEIEVDGEDRVKLVNDGILKHNGTTYKKANT